MMFVHTICGWCWGGEPGEGRGDVKERAYIIGKDGCVWGLVDQWGAMGWAKGFEEGYSGWIWGTG